MTDEFYACGECGAYEQGTYTRSKYALLRNVPYEQYDKASVDQKDVIIRSAVRTVLAEDEQDALVQLSLDIQDGDTVVLVEEVRYCSECHEEYVGVMVNYIE